MHKCCNLSLELLWYIMSADDTDQSDQGSSFLDSPIQAFLNFATELQSTFKLCSATSKGDHVGVTRALHAGADPNTCMPCKFSKFWGGMHSSVPVLIVAVAQGYVDVVTVLLEANADTEYKGTFRVPPLFMAIARGNNIIVEKLLNHEADVNALDSIYGSTAIHFTSIFNRVRIASMLQVCGCSLDGVDNEGDTPLHEAAWHGNRPITEWLVQQGVNVTAVNDEGQTAADCAESGGHKDLAMWLRSPNTEGQEESQCPQLSPEERQLCDIFPSVDIQTIKKCLYSSSGNVDLAATCIMEISESKPEELPNETEINKVVVLNFEAFPEPISKRHGADTDSTNLSQTFTNFGYDVNIHKDLTALDTEDVLNKLQMNTTMKSLILIILSHGVNKYCFYTRDGGIMDLDKIRKKFTDTACPQLRGKPKIILSNFCRGDDIEVQRDASALIEVPHHMITIHATVDNIMALRHPRHGTLFISNLCKVLKKDQNIQEMYNKLYEAMKNDGGTTPMMEVFAPFPKFTF